MNKRQKSIVEHSLALFLEKGIHNTSIQDIIDRAGISKGTFYNYFSSKNECVSAILEQLRYEVSLSRSELLIGKDAKDLELLIEQITLLTKFNEKRSMHAIYEELLYSGDIELRQLVLKHRISEFEWLSERLIEVYGDELRPYAFEASVIFYGILQHLQFTRRLMRSHARDTKALATSIFHYMGPIVYALIHEHTAVLEPDNLTLLKDNLNTRPIQKQDMIDMLKELLGESQIIKPQKELAQALLFELEQPAIREAVIKALLQPFTEAFEDTRHEKSAREISTMVWYYLKQK